MDMCDLDSLGEETAGVRRVEEGCVSDLFFEPRGDGEEVPCLVCLVQEPFTGRDPLEPLWRVLLTLPHLAVQAR